jgi:hypothetical protein
MKTTFTIKNLTETTLTELSTMAPRDAYAKLSKWAWGDLKHCVSVKYGSGAFRDRVEWNGAMRRVETGETPLMFKLEPRRGYKLATFTLA